MNLANTTKHLIETKCPNTFSLYAGYGMADGEYIYFPTAIPMMEKINDRGRVTKAKYKYADGSVLTYTYSTASETYKLSCEVNNA